MKNKFNRYRVLDVLDWAQQNSIELQFSDTQWVFILKNKRAIFFEKSGFLYFGSLKSKPDEVCRYKNHLKKQISRYFGLRKHRKLNYESKSS